MLKYIKYSLCYPIVFIAIALFLYLFFAFALYFVKQNPDFVGAESKQAGVLIYVLDNGFHTDIALPRKAIGVDWADFFPLPDDFAIECQEEHVEGEECAEHKYAKQHAPDYSTGFVIIGWGQKDIFTSELGIDEISPWLALKALMPNSEAAIRVYWSAVQVRAFWNPAYVRSVFISVEKYKSLVAFIKNSTSQNKEGKAVALENIEGSEADFYASTVKYGPIMTCNQWLNNALASAGVAVPLWSPFAEGIKYSLDKFQVVVKDSKP